MELPENSIPSTSMSSSLDDLLLQSNGFVLESPREGNHTISTTIPQPVDPEQAQQCNPVEHDDDDQSTVLSHASDDPFSFDSEFFESTFGGEDLDIKPLNQLLDQIKMYIQHYADFLQLCIAKKYGEEAQQYAQKVFSNLQEAEESVHATHTHLSKVKECLHCRNDSYQLAYTSDKIAREKIKATECYMQLTHRWATIAYAH
jgi:hypothetical protein